MSSAGLRCPPQREPVRCYQQPQGLRKYRSQRPYCSPAPRVNNGLPFASSIRLTSTGKIKWCERVELTSWETSGGALQPPAKGRGRHGWCASGNDVPRERAQRKCWSPLLPSLRACEELSVSHTSPAPLPHGAGDASRSRSHALAHRRRSPASHCRRTPWSCASRTSRFAAQLLRVRVVLGSGSLASPPSLEGADTLPKIPNNVAALLMDSESL